MKTMGFSELVLVSPRNPDPLRDDEAIALASGATDVLAGARIVSSLDKALAGCNFSVALSARPREFAPPLFEPRQLAEHLADDPTLNAALVFGNERFGLSNEQVGKCSALVNVPANPDYSSLNLSQAVQVLAYECRMASMGQARAETGIGFRGELASAVRDRRALPKCHRLVAAKRAICGNLGHSSSSSGCRLRRYQASARGFGCSFPGSSCLAGFQ